METNALGDELYGISLGLNRTMQYGNNGMLNAYQFTQNV